MTEPPMLAIGLMSGTSLDGTDAALVRIWGPTRIELIAFAHRPYDRSERARIEAVLAGGPIAELARLHTAIAQWSVEAIEMVLVSAHCRADQLGLIALHGQTMWHEPPLVTLQLGAPAILAERFGVRVVHDFRSRDVAAGGQGAPLVPLVDALCFSSEQHPRVLLNIGGMANATWVPAAGELSGVVAGDSGPGMAIIDSIARLVDPSLPFDSGGRLASEGKVDSGVLEELLADPYFGAPLPKSTGREHFGVGYAERLHRRVPGADGVRTAVSLTATTIAEFCTRLLPRASEVIAAGGGTHHPVLMRELEQHLARHEVELLRFDEQFFDGDAKEAVAFAMLGWLTVHGQPGNLPEVTG
ncbi:MAG TPA: anhydro-N-acetylmuramic acid kinase, partial [Gemmatimonadales bacterium]|nr:anhydro-N-acetylmuramic acid kinase [Gemmatimonadales bacterium]